MKALLLTIAVDGARFYNWHNFLEFYKMKSLVRKTCFALACVAATFGTRLFAQEEAQEPRDFGGIYPTLAYYNNEGECGTGAVVPWADRLWVITYGPHLPNGSSDKLYEIDAALHRTIRPESVGGTNANRMIHRESNQLFIGFHAIDAQGNVRTIQPKDMPGRMTSVARSWIDPEHKVYFMTMEEGLYEVDVDTLEARVICKDGNSSTKTAAEDVLPGYHGKGGYMSQRRLVYTNNGENSEAARKDPTTPSGCLAQWTGEGPGQGWEVVRRSQFTEATGPDGIYGGKTGEETLWSLGWDVRSVLLYVLDEGKWTTYRLPKASHCYDGAHGWNTEWPRIREIGDAENYLATMHGQFWSFPSDFRTGQARGIRPRSTYLKVIGDFAYWNGRVVFGCDDSAKNEFLNSSPFKGGVKGPGRSNSNLWFVEPSEIDSFGPALGRGAAWFNDATDADVPSDPYLFAGYDVRNAFFKFDAAEGSPEEVTLVFEVDENGDGNWRELKRESVAASADGGYAFISFSPEDKGEWIRVRCNAKLSGATCFFHYNNTDERLAADRAPIFDGLAAPSDASSFLTARMWARADVDRLAVVAQNIQDGKVASERYYELDESGAKLERVECKFEGGEQGTISRIKAMVDAKPVDPSLCAIDDLSVLAHYGGKRYRLPIGSEEAARVELPVASRLDREIATERDLFHVAGTFYELPAENAGGFPKLRPISTDSSLIVDYASYRGLLVLAGVKKDATGDSSRVVRSEDGECALWLGSIDELWRLGKPTGKGYVWRETKVVKDEPSDPILAVGFDKKRVEITNHSDSPVVVRVEADPTCLEDWREFASVEIPAGATKTVALDSAPAYWFRAVADRDADLSALFIYE